MVIGGGYATGRELAEFFLPSGPWGGLLGMLLAAVCWSVICAITFVYAHTARVYDYGAFFRELLGPAAFLFDAAYACLVLIMLSVFGAASGAIGHSLFGWPDIVGTLGLIGGIALFAMSGNESVERLFKVVTYFLYGVYGLFFILSLLATSGLLRAQFAAAGPASGWALGGLTYASYNVVGAVVILPVLRHLTSRKDAVIAGLLAGPIGMLPAVLFFICMVAYYPAIGSASLPSDVMLERLGLPIFHALFQLMIVAALLESGTGAVHAVNQRIAGVLTARGRGMPPGLRLLVSTTVLVVAVFVATRFGLVELIASGYRLLAYLFLMVYVVPLLGMALWTRGRFSRRPPVA